MSGFDSKAFMRTKFAPRIEEVHVPDLAEWYPEGTQPVWKVRGLTGHELGQANEAADRNRSVRAIVEALAGQSDSEKVGAIRNLLGVGTDAPQDIAKRIEHLTIGSVDPVCSQEMAVRLCESRPVEFYLLTTKILELTGKGKDSGKSKPSGTKVKSGHRSPSATPEGASSSK